MQQNIFKKDFPIFKTQPNLVYLDSAATALKPQAVIDAEVAYYAEYSANIHRGLYNIAQKATEAFGTARETLARFINSKKEEIIFTSGTTDSLNMLARLLEPKIKPGQTIVLSPFEHHANLIPWQQLAKRTGATLEFLVLTENGEIDITALDKIITEKTAIVSCTYISHVTGYILPIEKIIARAKTVGALSIIDAAQAVGHHIVDVKKLDCDFLAFSGHKVYGPTGIGVLYGKKELLDTLEPISFGGGMIREVSYEEASWCEVPERFEPGTPNIAGAIGLAAAVSYIENIGLEKIVAQENEIANYTRAQLQKIDGVILIGQTKGEHSGIISFILGDVHPHDIADILNRDAIAVRAGHHCAMPYMKWCGISGTVRVSVGMYTTKEDIDHLVAGLQKVKEIFSV